MCFLCVCVFFLGGGPFVGSGFKGELLRGSPFSDTPASPNSRDPQVKDLHGDRKTKTGGYGRGRFEGTQFCFMTL